MAQKRGRPLYTPTAEQRKMVELYAAVGTPHLVIADVLGVAEMTLRKHYRAELTQGLHKANAKVAGKLFNIAMAGNPAALIFWLKSRAGWRETNRLEHTGAEGSPIKVEAGDGVDLGKLSVDELKAMEALLAKASGS